MTETTERTRATSLAEMDERQAKLFTEENFAEAMKFELKLTDVGIFLATVSFPWTLKLFAGPVMDRFSFLEMGRRRPWVLGAQLGILTGCLVLSLGVDDFAWILTVGFIINFCAAWQDVAVDGLAIDVLPENERAQTNAFMFGGQTLGISSASAGGAWLLANYGLSSAAWVMALCVALKSPSKLRVMQKRVCVR